MAVHTVSWLAQVWQWTVHMATEQEQLDNWVTEHTGSSITTVSVYTVETAHTHHMERSAVCFMSSRTGDNSELDQSHTAHTVTSSSLACKLNSISSSILEWSTISYHICKRSLSKHRVWTAFSTNLEFSYMAHRTQTWRFDCVSIMATASSWHQRQHRRTHIHIIQHMATWHSQHRIWLKVNTVTKDELDKIRIAYIKVYGNRWREVFVKYYWCVYDGPELESFKKNHKNGIP